MAQPTEEKITSVSASESTATSGASKSAAPSEEKGTDTASGSEADTAAQADFYNNSTDLKAYRAMLSELKESLSRELSDLIRDEFKAVAGSRAATPSAEEADPATLAPTRAESPEEAYLRGRNEAIAERWEGLRGFPADAPSSEPTIKRRPSVWDSES